MHVFARVINKERTHFLELWYDEFDENPLLYAVCSVDLWRKGNWDYWVGCDPNEWDDYEGVRIQGDDPNDEVYVRSLKNLRRKGGVVLPVYCHEHGGITFRCSSFSDPWDSGQVGYAYMSTEQIAKLGWPKGKRGRKKAAEEYIRHMVGVMASYANGDIYGFTIYDKDGEVVDSCGGFYDCHYDKVATWLDDMKENVSEEFHSLFDDYYPGRMDDLEYSRRIPPAA